MKLLKLSLILVLVSLFAACGDDDSSDCIQSDWVGTYTGTVVCDGVSEEATITLTASGADKVVIKYETATIEAEFSPSDLNGCSISESGSVGGVDFSLNASLDGKNLSVTEVIGTDTCIITGAK